jgi:hypothetical protein
MTLNLLLATYNTMVRTMWNIQISELDILCSNVKNYRKWRVTWETDFVNGLQLTIMHIKRAYLLRSWK